MYERILSCHLTLLPKGSLLKENEHLHDVISLKSTCMHANPCLFRILDKLFVLVLHHLLLKKEKKNE
jgi:hypothetical protein